MPALPMGAYESYSLDATYGEVMASGTCCLRIISYGQNAPYAEVLSQSLDNYDLVYVDMSVHVGTVSSSHEKVPSTAQNTSRSTAFSLPFAGLGNANLF